MVSFQVDQLARKFRQSLADLLDVLATLLVVQVVEAGLKLLFLLGLLLYGLLLFFQSLCLLPEIVDRLLNLLPHVVLLEVLLDLLQLVDVVLGATVEQTSRFILVALARHADVPSFLLRDLLGSLGVVADEDLAKHLLHSGLKSLIKLDQIERKSGLIVCQLHDFFDVGARQPLHVDLLERHKRDVVAQDSALENVFRYIFVLNDDLEKFVAGDGIQGHAVFLKLLDFEKRAKSTINQ